MSAYSARKQDSAEQFVESLKDERLYTWVRTILRIGMAFSLAIMAIGTFLFVALDRQNHRVAVPLPQVVERTAAFDPVGIVAVGVVVLAMTPALSVLTSLLFFLLERDFKYALVSFAVLLVLALGVVTAL